MLAEAGRIAWSDADLPGMIEAGRRMQALDLPQGMPEAFAVNVMIALGRLLQRDPSAAPLIQELASRADLDDPHQLQIAGAASMLAGNDRAAHALLTSAITRARMLGAITKMPQTLAPLASLQMWEGSYPSAMAHAWEGVRLAHETGQEHLAAHFLAVLAWIAAVQGRAEECEALGANALEVGRAHKVRPPMAIATWALALSDLGMGRWPEAMARLEAVVAPHSPESHPVVAILATSDLVEAACRADRLDLAQAPLARFVDFAEPTAAAWIIALVARCRALISDAEPAAGFFDEALQRHAQAGRRFDQARTRLLYGEFLRRTRQRAEARSHLRSAIDTFEQLGASPWEQRARAELRATGETARKREPSTLTRLTPQQTQIVRLVAEGATNKEVASQLYLSPRTVDYHLRNVFVKLGITSRAELIHLQGIGEPAQAKR